LIPEIPEKIAGDHRKLAVGHVGGQTGCTAVEGVWKAFKLEREGGDF
jgi:hypothetical protein